MPSTRDAVPAPDQLRDRAAHRVADDGEALDAERVGDRDDVVGAVLEGERLRPDPAAVPALVERDHAVALGERCIDGYHDSAAVVARAWIRISVGAPGGPGRR